jgi:hypothetical protein
MNNRTCLSLMARLTIVFTAACTGSAESEAERLGEAAENAISNNAISNNAISNNAISNNAISNNALSAGTLGSSALSAIQDPGTDGDLFRLLVKYAVSCAFDSSQSFSFSWTDSASVVHNETYPGSLGLAPSWASEPLSLGGQKWVSACLAARTNYYGVTVTISLRGHIEALGAGASEAATYTWEEGAFWGNLFTSTPALYACHLPADDAHSRAAQRDCAAGHIVPETGAVVPCGIIQLLGSCEEYCSPPIDGDPSHAACWTDPSNKVATGTLRPITVLLP